MGKEYGQLPGTLMGLPRTLDVVALEEAIFWMSRSKDLEAEARRIAQANAKAKARQSGGRR